MMSTRWARLILARGEPTVRVLNIAHRGARAFAPENTIEAIEKSATMGADMVEIDVHLSRDGIPVVMHDDDLRRCSDAVRVFPGRGLFVSEFTVEELATLDAGSWYVEQLEAPAVERQPFLREIMPAERDRFVTRADLERYRSGRVRIPTLAECLDAANRLKLLLNIEIKSLPRMYPGIAERVVRTIEAGGFGERVLLSSFDHRQLAVVRAISPEIATAVLTRDRLHRPVRYLREVLDGDAYHPSAAGEDDSLGFGSIGGTLDQQVIGEIRETGLGFNVWTVNNPAKMRALVAAGVTGIVTDYPNRLREVC